MGGGARAVSQTNSGSPGPRPPTSSAASPGLKEAQDVSKGASGAAPAAGQGGPAEPPDAALGASTGCSTLATDTPGLDLVLGGAGPEHNQRMFRALFSSSSPLAAFLVDTCEATANFANDFIDLPILESYYRMWLGFKWRRAQFVQKEEATAAAAQNAAVLAGADVTSAAQAAAVARDRFLVTEVLGLPDPLAVAQV
ncbi:hypothetical protein HaLaN_14935, partial [Haematococcus lacustris]